MDFLNEIFRLIGVAGVVIILMAFIGYGVLCSWTRDAEESDEVDDSPDDDPDPGESNTIVKIPDTSVVSGISLYKLKPRFCCGVLIYFITPIFTFVNGCLCPFFLKYRLFGLNRMTVTFFPFPSLSNIASILAPSIYGVPTFVSSPSLIRSTLSKVIFEPSL